jgi:hypothetical protein
LGWCYGLAAGDLVFIVFIGCSHALWAYTTFYKNGANSVGSSSTTTFAASTNNSASNNRAWVSTTNVNFTPKFGVPPPAYGEW